MIRKNSTEDLVIKGKSNTACVWLHGFGANAWDLLPLAEIVDPTGICNHYFPNAPHDLYGYGPRGPRAWFPLDLSQLQQIEQSSKGLVLSDKPRSPVTDALPHLDIYLQEKEIQPDQLILGGFSQGAIMSLHWLLARGTKTRGLLLFSAAPLDISFIEAEAPKLAGQVAYQSHGRRDPVLAYSEGEKLARILKSAGFRSQWRPFDGVHEIPNSVLTEVASLWPEWTT